MDSISLILTIHVILLLLLPLLRRLFSLIFTEEKEAKLANMIVFTTVNLVLPLSLLAVFLFLNLTGSFSETTTKVLLFGSENYLFELGFQVTSIQVISYSFIFIISSLLSYRTILNQEKILKKYPDKISLLLAIFVLLLYSPNFFQLTLFMVFLDITILRLIQTSFRNSVLDDKRGVKQVVLSLIIGNSFLMSSFGLIIKLSKTFDFSSIFHDISFHYNLSNTFFVTVCSVFLVGLTAKISLFPFHEWKRKSWNSNNPWIFQIVFLYVSFTLLFFFITPFMGMIPVIKNGIAWYGVIIAISSSVLAVLMQKKEVGLTLLLSFYCGIILLTIGLNSYLVAFQQTILLPFIFGILTVYFIKKEEPKEESTISRTPTILVSSLLSIPILIAGLTLVGVPPLNNSLVSITSSLEHPNILFKNGLLALGVISSAFVFYLIFRTIYGIWAQKSQAETKLLNVLVVIGSSFGIILFSILLPYLLPLEHFPVLILSESRLYLKSALPIAAIGFIFSLLYIITFHYFRSKHEFFSQKSKSISSIILKIITYDFIFELCAVIYTKIIVPSATWIKSRIIIGFFVEIVYHYTYLWLLLLIRGLRKLVFDIIIQTIKKVFEKTSKFLRSLERINLRQQLQLAAVFLVILLVVVIAFYYGGTVR
ncbi:MAG: hypothetical protein H7645_02275 [Candidatus Heimdallarchaeota archaeon]|nr:hypothetical protein [Candidatus Heimdallarchaeota archaeon]MCK4769142.1 hypothetical protein [Candidatus Heimdallarchaeota archaeon]